MSVGSVRQGMSCPGAGRPSLISIVGARRSLSCSLSADIHVAARPIQAEGDAGGPCEGARAVLDAVRRRAGGAGEHPGRRAADEAGAGVEAAAAHSQAAQGGEGVLPVRFFRRDACKVNT